MLNMLHLITNTAARLVSYISNYFLDNKTAAVPCISSRHKIPPLLWGAAWERTKHVENVKIKIRRNI